MIKKISALLLVLFALAFTQSVYAKAELVKHHNNEKGYSIELPKDWGITNDGKDSPNLACMEKDNKASIAVTVELLPEKMDFERYYKLSIENVSKTLKNFKELESGTTKIGGLKAKWLIYTFTSPAGIDVHYLGYMFVKGDDGYIIACGSVAGSFGDYKDIFEKSAKSFEFEPRYYDSANGFSLEFPEGWKLEFKGKSVMAQSPSDGPDDKIIENILVNAYSIPKDITLDDYYKASVNNLSSILKNYKVISEKDVKLGGQPAKMILLTHEIEDITIKAVAYMVIANGRAFVMTFTSDVDNYKKYEQVFEKAAKTFRLEKIIEQAGPKMVRHIDKDNGFSIEFPESWKPAKGKGNIILKGSDGVNPENGNLIIEDVGEEITLEEYYKLNMENAEKSLGEFKIHSSGNAKIDGLDAKWAVYSFKHKEFVIVSLVCLIVNDQKGYIITAGTLDKRYVENQPLFESIIKSFRMEK